MSNEEMFVKVSLQSWDLWIGRINKLFDSLSNDEMLTEIAPGKNRPVYILGHLLVVNDGMIPTLRLGEPAHAGLTETYLKQPDRAVADTPSVPQLRQYWKDLNPRLSELFDTLSPSQWLERHALVSEEDFEKEPYRNRLAVLLSRTTHVGYHLGQLVIRSK
jgi:hypothetical protein